MSTLAGCQSKPSSMAMEEAAAQRSSFAGQQAPDFTLTNQEDDPVTLNKLRGKWVVLYFYPKDDTPGCACQATEFTELLTSFRDMNAEVYGISEDPPPSHRFFIRKYDLKINLLSDPEHTTMEKYGAWTNTSLGTRTIRSTVIVDPAGLVSYHWPEVIPTGHAKRVRQKLVQLQQAKP